MRTFKEPAQCRTACPGQCPQLCNTMQLLQALSH
jgi:hypothetical protein